MSKWIEKIKEKEGRKGLIPWLSVSIQKGILIYTAVTIILVIPIYVFAGEYWPGGMIFTIIAAIIVYVGFRTSWLKNVERANKLTRFAGAVIVGFGVFGLTMVLLELVLCLLLFLVITKALFSNSKEHVIKREGDKEVVYEKGLFDRRVGELHKNWDGSKETRGIFEPHVKVEKPGIFSKEREAEVEGKKGVFKKGLFEKQSTFYPDEESEEANDD